jgi:AcrR family transcriptional regulator
MLEEPIQDRRTERHEATKAEIVEAAWEIARAEGLAAVSLRDVAHRVRMRPPSLYGYFDSKNAIYDAMYAQGCQQFVDAGPWDEMTGDALHDLGCIVHYFVRFCAVDPARYQLVFQRTIPGFEPSLGAFAISQAGLARVGEQLRRCGLTDDRAVDLFTALGTGLADQQISNDPGGDRWIRLIDDAVEMFFDYMPKHTRSKTTARQSERRSR